MSLQKFIKQNKRTIDATIRRSGSKPTQRERELFAQNDYSLYQLSRKKGFNF